MLLTNNKGIFRNVPSNLAQSFLKEGWVEVVDEVVKDPVVEDAEVAEEVQAEDQEAVSAETEAEVEVEAGAETEVKDSPKPRAKRGTTK